MEELDNKEKILKGAEELFMRYGVRSISMDDIARHLSVSKKTLYQYFADKEELVTMVSKSHLERSTKDYETIRETSANSIEELAMLSRCMRKDMENINPGLLYDLQKFHPKAWTVWLNFKNRYIRESVVRNLKQGIEDGYIRPEVDPEILATIRIELVQLAFNPELFPREHYKLAEVQSQIFDHFVFGLVTDKGRKLYLKYKQLNQQPTSTIL
jgi:TetR/AcrR family transcriptional regulator, cholesterol catabolism regulator